MKLRGTVVRTVVIAVVAGALAAPAQAAFPGGNGRIVFERFTEGNPSVVSVNPDGSGATQLGDGGDATWSADGKRIAFAVRRGGEYDIWVMNADGTGRTRVTTSPGSHIDPAWSPDGTKIAFSRFDVAANNWEIYVVDLATSAETQLTRDTIAGEGDFASAWSPDGSRIAYHRAGTGTGYDIWVMNADGTGKTRVSSPNTHEVEPAWSPDGTRIAMQSYADAVFRWTIAVMNADGTGERRVTPAVSQRDDFSPAWSPEGEHLVFQRDVVGSTGKDGIYVIGVDGTDPTLIADGVVRSPDWQPIVPDPPCRQDRTGSRERGPVSGRVHGLEGAAGPAGGTLHQVNCQVIVPLGL